MTADLTEVRAAKTRVAKRLACLSTFNGIGIERYGEGYGLVVFLTDKKDRRRIEEIIDGVHVSVEVSGRVRAQK